MINYFAKKGAFNIVLLFVYAVILKAVLFVKPQLPVQHFSDGVLYKQCIILLQKTGNLLLWSNVLTFLLLYIQALFLCKLMATQKLIVVPNYLAGMSFLLITSFFPNWQMFGSVLIVNTILIIIVQQLKELQNTVNIKSTLFNIGLLLCTANFFYSFSFSFIILVIIVLLTFHSFKLNEYIVLLLGYGILYYFYIAYLFLVNKLVWKNLKLQFSMKIPLLQNAQLLFIAVMLILGLLLLGLFTVQKNSSKMPIQSRKSWSVMFFWVIISLVLPIFNNNIYFWFLCLLPISLFIAAFFYDIKNKKFKAVIHWTLFLFAIIVNYYI